MTKLDALRIFSAAQGDPVLAAWAFVLYENNLPSACDVSPHDHLEAYQDLFTSGLVSSDAYNRMDIRQTFFSGTNPERGEVQSVLAAMDSLHPDQENRMTKAKLPTAAFSDSLVKSEPSKPAPIALGSARPTAGLSAFRPNNEALPQNKTPVQVEAFAPAAFGPPAVKEVSLPAQRPTVDARTYRRPGEIDCKLFCCGPEPLVLVDEGGDIVPADCVPQEEFSLIEFMFHAECPHCGAMFHTSVGKPIPREAY
jgi:hypothetical protein